jgi:hypothetical protein
MKPPARGHRARQYSEFQRADFGAFVREKRYRLE